MICLNCNAELLDGLRFCNECGTPAAVPCARCGSSNRVGARFCGQCSAPLAGGGVPWGAGEDERRQLTVLFCDLVGSSALSARLDPEDFGRMLRRYHDTCAEITRQFDGYVAQFLGDGVLVYFGYPLAYEDSARRAVQAGLAMRDAIATLSAQLSAEHDVALRVRIGIHTGPVVVSVVGQERPERLALGETPNVAARLQELAQHDTVVISDTTHRLTDGYFHFRDLGQRALKGLSQPIGVFEAIRDSGAASRIEVAAHTGFTPLVGRQGEISFLLERWQETVDGGGPVVSLTGEPGIGKSRHVHVLADHVRQHEHVIVEIRCSAYHQSSVLYPFVELLARTLGLAELPSPDAKLARIAGALGEVGQRIPEAVSVIASLLSVPLPGDGGQAAVGAASPKQRQATFQVLLAWVVEVARRRPVLLIAEDLHWADPSTLELLNLAIARDPLPRVLTLLTSRPELRPPWTSASRVHNLALGRLPRRQAEDIVAGVAGNRALPPEVLERVLDKADGVPLFVEEITKAVLESGLLAERAGRFELAGAMAPALIPSTVQDSLMARLDRLGNSKPIAQLAATLGREFRRDLLQAVSGVSDGELSRALARLEGAELVFRRGEQETYAFKHALIQDAAYQCLPRGTRQRYHRQIAEAITARFPGIAETQPDFLAHHYAGAGLADEALGQWQAAGQRATARSAFAEAISAFGSALDQLATLPASAERDKREIPLRVGLGLALISTRGFAAKEVEETYSRAQELCEQFGDIPSSVLYGAWVIPVVRGDRAGADRFAALWRRVAESSDDSTTLLVAHAALATRAFYRGEYRLVEEHCAQALARFAGRDPKRELEALLANYGSEALLYAHLYLAWCHVTMGEADRARAGLREALALAEMTSHPYVIATVLAFYGGVAHDLGDREMAREVAAREIALSSENGFLFWLACGSCAMGWVKVGDGDVPGGVAQIQQGLSLLRNMGALVVYPYYCSFLVEAHLVAGDVAAAQAALDEALPMARSSLACNHEPDLLRLAGEILLRDGRPAEAEQRLRESMAIASRQEAKLPELRAAMVLARIMHARGETREARALVSAVYARFTEGLETRHLQAARAMLAELC